MNLKCFFTAEMTMTDTTEVVLMTITGGRMNPTGTLIEIPGMDVVSQNQQVNIFYRHSFLISIIITFEYKSLKHLFSSSIS